MKEKMNEKSFNEVSSLSPLELRAKKEYLEIQLDILKRILKEKRIEHKQLETREFQLEKQIKQLDTAKKADRLSSLIGEITNTIATAKMRRGVGNFVDPNNLETNKNSKKTKVKEMKTSSIFDDLQLTLGQKQKLLDVISLLKPQTLMELSQDDQTGGLGLRKNRIKKTEDQIYQQYFVQLQQQQKKQVKKLNENVKLLNTNNAEQNKNETPKSSKNKEGTEAKPNNNNNNNNNINILKNKIKNNQIMANTINKNATTTNNNKSTGEKNALKLISNNTNINNNINNNNNNNNAKIELTNNRKPGNKTPPLNSALTNNTTTTKTSNANPVISTSSNTSKKLVNNLKTPATTENNQKNLTKLVEKPADNNLNKINNITTNTTPVHINKNNPNQGTERLLRVHQYTAGRNIINSNDDNPNSFNINRISHKARQPQIPSNVIDTNIDLASKILKQMKRAQFSSKFVDPPKKNINLKNHLIKRSKNEALKENLARTRNTNRKLEKILEQFYAIMQQDQLAEQAQEHARLTSPINRRRIYPRNLNQRQVSQRPARAKGTINDYQAQVQEDLKQEIIQQINLMKRNDQILKNFQQSRSHQPAKARTSRTEPRTSTAPNMTARQLEGQAEAKHHLRNYLNQRNFRDTKASVPLRRRPIAKQPVVSLGKDKVNAQHQHQHQQQRGEYGKAGTGTQLPAHIIELIKNREILIKVYAEHKHEPHFSHLKDIIKNFTVLINKAIAETKIVARKDRPTPRPTSTAT